MRRFGLFGFLLRLPSFMSSCGFGGWRTRAPISRLVSSRSSRAFVMANFENLDPHTRCFALVGQFLQSWSVMERSLQNAIGAALSIETTKLQILCANIRFRDK